jgi:hypothetical protein
MNMTEGAEAAPLQCSPDSPWGLHPAVIENVCPRCGWVARGGPEKGASSTD